MIETVSKRLIYDDSIFNSEFNGAYYIVYSRTYNKIVRIDKIIELMPISRNKYTKIILNQKNINKLLKV